jgi:hypothetical protein
MRSTIVLSGEGEHADPWHSLPETSAKIAELIGRRGDVAVVTSISDLQASLDDADLLVVNASANRSAPVPEDADFGRVLDEPLYVHEQGGAHPLIWARTIGDSRVVYDALGHDVRSYESPEHVELLGRVVSWLRHQI